MNTEATPETGAMSVFDAVDSLVTEAPEATPEEVTEETPDVEPVESTEEQAADADQAESEEAEPEESDEEPQHLTLDDYGDLTIPVKINGEERRVSLSEAAKGYQLEADYTRKTTELAEQRKAVATETQTLRDTVQQLQAQNAQLLAETIGEEPSLELAREDPYEYTQRKAEYDARKAAADKANGEAQQAMQVEAQQRAAQEFLALQQKAPEFKEREYVEKLVLDASENYGFTAEEIAGLPDHRQILVLRDALAFRASKKVNPKVEKALSKPAKVVKPGPARSKADISAEKRAAANKKLARPGGVSINEYLDAKFD